MRVRTMLLADAVNTTAEGKINLLGEFGVIFAAGFPARHAQMWLWIQLEIEPKDIGRTVKTEVKLLDPDGKLLLSVERPFEVPPPPKPSVWKSGVNIIIPTQGLVFPAPGDYAFTFEVNGQELGRAPLALERITELESGESTT